MDNKLATTDQHKSPKPVIGYRYINHWLPPLLSGAAAAPGDCAFPTGTAQ
ncbi:hypothetical protein ACIQ7D_04685 [Streptomyces sp. NPDC096310]